MTTNDVYAPKTKQKLLGANQAKWHGNWQGFGSRLQCLNIKTLTPCSVIQCHFDIHAYLFVRNVMAIVKTEDDENG